MGYVNAEAAWAEGYTGAGILIGVIDDGIHPAHPELVGRVHPDSVDIVPLRNQLVTDNSHGSELSSLMVGNFNNLQTVGIAFDAQVLAVRADDGTGGFSYSVLADALNYAVAHGVDIVNFSLGGSGAAPPAFVNALQAATNAGVIIVISAGNDGQAGATDVNYPGFYANNAAVSNGLIIVAGGLNSDGTPNANSNPPGTTANWYMMAPGWQTVVPDYGPAGAVPGFQQCGAAAGLPADLCMIQGTSYASPQISAGMALLMQAAPGLTSQQLVQLALIAARDEGAPGTDGIYGRGVFDIARAFAPVGPLAFATADGGEALALNPVGVVGAAFGDAFADQSAWASTAFDGFGRSFAVSLAPGWAPAALGGIADAGAPALWREAGDGGAFSVRFIAEEAAPPAALTGRLREAPQGAFRAATRIDGVSLTFAAHAPALDPATPGGEAGHLSFAGADLSVAATGAFFGGEVSFTSQAGEAALGRYGASARRANAVRISDALGPLDASLTYGVVTEEGALLGLTWDRAWGAAPNGITQFAAVSLGWSPFAALEFGAAGEIGRASLEGGGWLTLAAPLTTSAASMGVRWRILPEAWARRGFAGALSLTLAQPIRVEDGAFSALLPVSDAWGVHHLSFEARRIGASPSGREIETRLSYWLWSGAAFTAHADLAHRREPGHRADAADALEALFGLRMAY